ncbi:ATP-binding protein [Actinomadura fibrosa]|uniref:ATP-binding protein n=1 Tax=Actinomadura fibrosa TaxID=111802 RepID=A0ABW2XRV9_9ACTN
MLRAECEDLQRRRSERRVKVAGFPRRKRIGEFDFDANPNVPAAVVHGLVNSEWGRNGRPLCLIGDSGSGKSHLLIALGTEAAMAGFRVEYVRAARLANELVEAAGLCATVIETGTDSYRLAMQPRIRCHVMDSPAGHRDRRDHRTRLRFAYRPVALPA